jgi:hypothetical protein
VKWFVLLAALALWPAAAWADQAFEGAWFRVTYPDGFVALGSQKSLAADGYDSATFLSPGNQVEFYIFSPQVGGKPEDLERATASETLIASSEAKSSNRIVKWRTYQARDKSYTRSIEETRTPDGLYVTRVVGIKYRDAAALAKYKASYAAFKASYEAYAD